MPHFEFFGDAYPEHLLAATRNEIRRIEHARLAREARARRRRERRAALRLSLSRWLGR